MLLINFTQDPKIQEWVRKELYPDIDDFGESTTIAIEFDKKPIAAVVFNNFYGRDIQATIATIDPRWATRKVLWHIFAYPFLQLGCRRISAMTRSKNLKAQSFLERLGFKREGELRQWYEHENAIVYGMTYQECNWLEQRG